MRKQTKQTTLRIVRRTRPATARSVPPVRRVFICPECGSKWNVLHNRCNANCQTII